MGRPLRTTTSGKQAAVNRPQTRHATRSVTRRVAAARARLRLENMPTQVQDRVASALWPTNSMLHINPGGGPRSLPHDVFTTAQLSRLATTGNNHILIKVVDDSADGLTRWCWETDDATADNALLDSCFEWFKSQPPAINNDLRNLRRVLGRTPHEMPMPPDSLNIPVMLTAPGVPEVEHLSRLNRYILERSRVLAFRYGVFECHHDALLTFLRSLPTIELLLLPPQVVTLDLGLDTWSGVTIAHGIQGGHSWASLLLQEALINFVPHMASTTARNRTVRSIVAARNQPLRWVGEIFVVNRREAAATDGEQVVSALRCLVTKEVTATAAGVSWVPARPQDISIMGAEYLRYWRITGSDVFELFELDKTYRRRVATMMAQQPQQHIDYLRRTVATTLVRPPIYRTGDAAFINRIASALRARFRQWYLDHPNLDAIEDLRGSGKCLDGAYLLLTL